jgi:hypothetical protein
VDAIFACSSIPPPPHFVHTLNDKIVRLLLYEIFNHVAYTFGPCIVAWSYLRPILTIDTGFLSDRYVGNGSSDHESRLMATQTMSLD